MTEVSFLSDPLRTPLAYDPCFKGEQMSRHFVLALILFVTILFRQLCITTSWLFFLLIYQFSHWQINFILSFVRDELINSNTCSYLQFLNPI
jgi:hypothetical protein